MTSYYDRLGVAVDADLGEVRRAYHRKAQLLHPDRYVGSPESERSRAEAEMKALNEAWGTLRSAEARRRYDSAIGVTGTGDEDERLETPEPETPPEPFRRKPRFFRSGVSLAVVLLLIGSIVGSVVAAVSGSDDSSPRWSASAVAELRFAALNAGLSAPQAECFVEALTGRYGPSEPVDLTVTEQLLAACR